MTKQENKLPKGVERENNIQAVIATKSQNKPLPLVNLLLILAIILIISSLGILWYSNKKLKNKYKNQSKKYSFCQTLPTNV